MKNSVDSFFGGYCPENQPGHTGRRHDSSVSFIDLPAQRFYSIQLA
jgi:hypothetical protein